MSREFRVLPECYIDTCIIEMIGFGKPNHQDNISTVAASMQNAYKNRLAIGLIDNDKKNVPDYFDEFVSEGGTFGLDFKKHKENKHYIILVENCAEQWLLDTAEELEVDSSKYGFKDLKSLLRVTKHSTVSQNQKFKDFLNTLKQKKGSPLKELKAWIEKILDC